MIFVIFDSWAGGWSECGLRIMEAEDNGGGAGMSEHKAVKVSRNHGGEAQQQAELPQAKSENHDFS